MKMNNPPDRNSLTDVPIIGESSYRSLLPWYGVELMFGISK